MNTFTLEKITPKFEVQKALVSLLTDQGFRITEINFERPWGGYVRVAEEQSKKFIENYYAGTNVHHTPGLMMTPKLLAVAPGIRLSWQYHKLRNEIWRVIFGPMAVMLSQSDDQPVPQIYNTNDIIKIQTEHRHRAIGLENWGVWAELWQHVDPEHPSTEQEDIVRVQDDFART
jgi:mannose-6-phosphate isomerase-like protein (cupin superfamily)